MKYGGLLIKPGIMQPEASIIPVCLCTGISESEYSRRNSREKTVPIMARSFCGHCQRISHQLMEVGSR